MRRVRARCRGQAVTKSISSSTRPRSAGSRSAKVRTDPRIRAQARAKLAFYRRRLGGQTDLVTACDLICGRELTPREAGKSEREVVRLEAMLLVALDLLAAAEG